MSQGWFRGSVGWGRFGGGNVTSRCHVYFAFYVHAFYATYCSQHSHHSSVPSVPSLFPIPYLAASSSLDLAWLIFNIVSWFSSPSSRFFSFLFRSISLSLSCHLLYAVSLSCRDLWSATCHHHPLSCRRGTGIGHLHLSMEQAACLNICLFTHTYTHRGRCF